MNQPDFADAIGISKRTYNYRITGQQPDWTFGEVVKASKFNRGQVTVSLEGKTYQVTIKEVNK